MCINVYWGGGGGEGKSRGGRQGGRQLLRATVVRRVRKFF